MITLAIINTLTFAIDFTLCFLEMLEALRDLFPRIVPITLDPGPSVNVDDLLEGD